MRKLTDLELHSIYSKAFSEKSSEGIVTASGAALRAIESAATEPLLQRIADLERKSDQDDETIIWQAKEISEKTDKLAELDARIAELEQRNSDFHEGCEIGRAVALAQVKHAQTVPPSTCQRCAELERQLEEAQKDAERLDFIEKNPLMRLRMFKKHWSYIGITNYEYPVFKTAREAIDAAMQKGQS